MTEEEKYIICINCGGLGNRLKGLISVMRLSEKLARKHLLYWQNNQYCGCEFEDLFENKFSKINESELKKIKKQDYELYNGSFVNSENPQKYLLFNTWKFVLLPGEIPPNINFISEIYPSEEGSNIDFEYNKVPEGMRIEIISYLKKLVPIQKIRETIDEFSQKNDISNYIGLHIRRGDNKFSVDGREEVSSDELFIEKIKSMPDEKFFLCTDSTETETKFKELFKERIITYHKGNRKRSKKESLQEALIDMLLLSKTKHIIGSYLSTFTELAWWFGECKNKIEIVGIENVKQSPMPTTFYQKVIRKIKFYKVNFQRWFFGVYK